jgi:HAD superfamily hydrolase (TIGR01509 family)
MARGVVFDMDGVLADTEGLHLRSLQEILAPFGITFTQEDNTPYVGHGGTEFWESVGARYDLPDPPGVMTLRREEAMLRNVAGGVRPMEGAVDLVRALRERGIPLAVASSTPPRQIEAILDGVGVRDAFGPVISGEDPEVARGKPAPDIYLEACRALGLPPHECIAIEDSANGVRSGRAAGLYVVAVPCAETRTQDFREADTVLRTLKEFDLSLLEVS